MGRLFGTDGVRGVANTELTPELAYKLGKVGAYVLSEEKERPVILIGKDTRISGDMFEDVISAGILAMGADVIKVGVLPTPAVAYLVKTYKADAGIVISASHNPFEFNGIKFFNGEGFKLDDAIEDRIESIINDGVDLSSSIKGEKLGRRHDAAEEAFKNYAEYLKSTIDVDIKGMKIILDCANGAAYRIAKRVFSDLGASLSVLATDPNGLNINLMCGSTHPGALQRAVLREGADIGLAFDGDADRLIAVDELGGIIDGDKMICICAKMLKDSGQLKGNKVTATVMSNLGFHKAMEAMGCEVDITAVGDRYVLESMLKTGCVIGGEQSGHIIFLDHSTTGDGILSALQLVKAIKISGEKPSVLAGRITIYPQVLVNALVNNENKKKYADDPEITAEIEKVEKIMSGEGRVLIRPSGTEPLVRVMIEGKDENMIRELAENLAGLLSKKFG